MELKVGDRVRWIKGSVRPIGTRGVVEQFLKDLTFIHWDTNVTVAYDSSDSELTVNIIKEFQPGDRVVRLEAGRQQVQAGMLGRVAETRENEFTVAWDNGYLGSNGKLCSYRYADALVGHAPSSTVPDPLAYQGPPITLPPPPPPEPSQEPPRRSTGRCYMCHAPDSEWLRDRYTCDACMERYR